MVWVALGADLDLFTQVAIVGWSTRLLPSAEALVFMGSSRQISGPDDPLVGDSPPEPGDLPRIGERPIKGGRATIGVFDLAQK